MSEIERLSETYCDDCNGVFFCDDGDYVLYKDHLSIVDALNSELQKYRSICSEFQEELKEAGLNEH